MRLATKKEESANRIAWSTIKIRELKKSIMYSHSFPLENHVHTKLSCKLSQHALVIKN